MSETLNVFWGASLAGTLGLKPSDLAPIRAAAMKGSAEHGTPQQKAAADEYTSAVRLLPIRDVLNAVITTVAGPEITAHGGALDPAQAEPILDLTYPQGGAIDVGAWADGPQDVPAMVQV